MRLLLSGIVVCFLLVGCSKPDIEPNTAWSDQGLRSWCRFRASSLWIYREINSGATDTVRVTGYYEEKVTDPEVAYHTRFVLQTQSSNDSIGLHTYYGFRSIFRPEQFEMAESYQDRNSSSLCTRFFVSDPDSIQQSQGLMCTNIPVFTLSNGTPYYNVKKFECSSSQNGNWIKAEYYDHNLGVVRREMFNGETWELFLAVLVH